MGAKDITAIDWISDHVRLDWAMFACSITPYSHGDAAKRLLKKLGAQVAIQLTSCRPEKGPFLAFVHGSLSKSNLWAILGIIFWSKSCRLNRHPGRGRHQLGGVQRRLPDGRQVLRLPRGEAKMYSFERRLVGTV